ncbi:MAG TPA: hypothetical protein VGQ39_16280 [Pyrinomonadaceae bacterium]|nr:hypothetical protein [Pyrinomonadaceae bacterium]
MFKFNLLTACVVLSVVSGALGQNPQSESDQRATRPFNMLVLGDSILWGQGLKTENKPWYHVKLWLEKNTGRPVIERIEAHSGAVIERSSLTDNLTSTNREVNLGLPTVHDEIESALKFYSDGSLIDLVLVSGCGNDVGVQNLLNAAKTEEVDDMTRAKCGAPMESLLRRIIRVFPSEHSFAAPETRLWGFNRSPFRMMLVILSFGKILLPSNDEMRKNRTASCNELYAEQPNEASEQKKERKAQRLYCRSAALGHPNKKGALLYADTITSILKSTIGVAAFSAP